MNRVLQRKINAGMKLLRENHAEAADQLALQLLTEFPDEAESYLYAADTALVRGDLERAIACLDSHLRNNPDNLLLTVRKAQIKFNARHRTEALEIIRGCTARGAEDLWAVRTIGRILRDCQDLDGARDYLLAALERFGPVVELLYDLAIVEYHMNLPLDAQAHVQALLELHPNHASALHLRSALRRQSVTANNIDDLQQRLVEGSKHKNVTAAIQYALAKEYEDLERYDDAFAALQSGAAVYRSTLTYDGSAEIDAHQHIMRNFTPEVAALLPPGYLDDSPIFVVGMPRTGTTVVERLLAGHSAVTSLGEFPDFPELLARAIATTADADSLSLDFREIGERYIRNARQLNRDSPRFVDKLPFNFQYCGYILAALPQARIIHLRRDPLDTCYAVYKTLFFGAYSFSYELNELADYYISYRQLMEHWHHLYPARVLDVQYESLVNDPGTEAERIIDWCCLPWESSVLDFHRLQEPCMTASAMQVREPLHKRSIGSWRRAERGMDPVRRKLLTAGLLG